MCGSCIMEVYGPTHQPLLRLTRVRKTTGHDLVTHVEKESMTSTSQMVGRAPLGGHSEVPGDGGGRLVVRGLEYGTLDRSVLLL